MSDHDAAQAARGQLTRSVAVCQELLDQHADHAGYKTSAEWLAAVIGNAQDVNAAAREYLKVTEPAQATAY